MKQVMRIVQSFSAILLVLSVAQSASASHFTDNTVNYSAETIGFACNIVSGNATGGTQAWYEMTVLKGREYTLTATRTSGDLLPNIRVWDQIVAENSPPAGNIVVSSSPDNSISDNTSVIFTPTISGTFTVTVSVYSTDSGNFSLTVSHPDEGSEGTIFTGGNSFAGNTFDVVASETLTITGFDVNLTVVDSVNTIAVYYRTGTSVGFEDSSAGWTLLGKDTNVIGAGANTPSCVDVGGLVLQSGQTYGFYLDLESYSSSSLAYTNGVPTNFVGSRLTITTQKAKGNPAFTGTTFADRQWNGNIHFITQADTPFVAQTTDIDATSLPFSDPSYAANGSFNINVANGSCTSTYTVNATPIAGSGPGSSTPPPTTVTTYIGFGQGNFFFGNAGAGDYTLTVTSTTGSCVYDPGVNPDVFTVSVPQGVYATPYSAVGSDINAPTFPFGDPSYTANGNFDVVVGDGDCTGTYTVNATPVAGSGPGGTDPPSTTFTTYIGFPSGNRAFDNAGPGDYTITVTETSACNFDPQNDPTVFIVTVPDTQYETPYAATAVDVMSTSLEFLDPSYAPDGSFSIRIVDGSCTGTYTVNASPVAGSAPDGSTPPSASVNTYIGFNEGDFIFATAGAGFYTVTVTETSGCLLNPNSDPRVIQVHIHEPCENINIGTLSSSDPTWDRIQTTATVDLGCNLAVADSGNNGQYYDVYLVEPTQNVTFTAEIYPDETTLTDTIIALYCDPFDPANPGANLIATDDDDGDGFLSYLRTTDAINLTAGSTYHLVVTTFQPGATTGDYFLCTNTPVSPVIDAHSADQNQDFVISLTELLRVIQFFNIQSINCLNGSEDGYFPGNNGDTSCAPHASDYNPQNWIIELQELLRMIQFFNTQAFYYCPGVGEDEFCPGVAP